MPIPAGQSRTWRYRVLVHHGNTDAARTALTKATQAGEDASIRESAEKMLAELP
jgi:hypothetical protein